MKQHTLRRGIVLRFVLIVLAVISVISLASNVLITWQFEEYVTEQQSIQAEKLADNLSYQYDPESAAWNLDYVHGTGMYALEEGYILCLYDRDHHVLWDAENHDMTLCHQVMGTIAQRMEEERPDLKGEFITREFELQWEEQVIGYLDISYYSPYYLNENAFQFVDALNRILTAVCVISLIGAILMGLLLTHYITGPISHAVKTAKQISGGDYQVRFQPQSKTKELSELAQSIHQMAESLEKQNTLRKRLTSDIAHELRTPMANVSSYLEMMMMGIWEPTPERLHSCYDELQRLLELTAELERLQQAEDENLQLHRSDVNLLQLAESVRNQFQAQLSEKRQSYEIVGEEAVVSADSGKIQQVMVNLFSNAVKYTGEGGHIRIRIEDREQAGIIQLEDDGIGISDEDCGRIFERFYRADQSRSRKTGGAGIGLTIVKAIVQAHGGSVTVRSEIGKGSCFTVSLPKAANETE